MDWLYADGNCHVDVIPASPEELQASVGSETRAQPLLGGTDLGGAGLSKPPTLWPKGFPPNPAGPPPQARTRAGGVEGEGGRPAAGAPGGGRERKRVSRWPRVGNFKKASAVPVNNALLRCPDLGTRANFPQNPSFPLWLAV